MDGWQAAAVVVKAITYGASLMGPGGALFLLIFGSTLAPGERVRFTKAALGGVAVAAVASLARISVISGMLGGSLGDLVNGQLIAIVLHAGEGRATITRLIGLVLVAIGLQTSWGRFVGTITGVAFVCVSFALVGHAEAAGPKPIPGGFLVIHLLGLTFWIGALYPLWHLAIGPDVTRIAGIVKRFGELALSVVAALMAAGGILLWILVGGPSAILTSAYGRLVLVKFLLVAALLTLAAVNKLRLTPRFVSGDRTAAISLRRSITAEMAVAALILLVTATFTTIVGPPTLD